MTDYLNVQDRQRGTTSIASDLGYQLAGLALRRIYVDGHQRPAASWLFLQRGRIGRAASSICADTKCSANRKPCFTSAKDEDAMSYTRRVIIVPAAFQQFAQGLCEAAAEVTQVKACSPRAYPLTALNPLRTTSAAARLPMSSGTCCRSHV